MNKTSVFEAGLTASKALRAVGYGVNLNKLCKKIKLEGTQIMNENEALLHDWEAVSKEVVIAIGRFERENGIEQHLRRATNELIESR